MKVLPFVPLAYWGRKVLIFRPREPLELLSQLRLGKSVSEILQGFRAKVSGFGGDL